MITLNGLAKPKTLLSTIILYIRYSFWFAMWAVLANLKGLMSTEHVADGDKKN